jgi:hypothetical protein
MSDSFITSLQTGTEARREELSSQVAQRNAADELSDDANRHFSQPLTDPRFSAQATGKGISFIDSAEMAAKIGSLRHTCQVGSTRF